MRKITVFAAAFALISLLCTAVAFASPPCPGERKLTQPEGQELTATLKGDEWMHWYETEQGDVIVRGEDGWWRYAKLADGKLAPLEARAGRDERPADAATGQGLKKAVEKIGSVTESTALPEISSKLKAGGVTSPGGPQKLLVILISFTDIAASQSDAYWSGKMFADYSAYPTKTDANSSVNDYYKEVSGGKFWFVPAAETSGTANDGVIRVTLNRAHPSYSDSTFNNDSWTVASECLAAADGQINYAEFDANGNGVITPDELHIVMILAGYEQAYGDYDKAVWAHSFGLYGSWLKQLDGVYVGGDYTQQGETHTNHPATIGVLAHELGHSLGLPDLYDYGYDSLGLGVYSLMAGGSWEFNGGSNYGSSPTHLDAWCKYLLGFVTPSVQTGGIHALNAISTGSYNVITVPTTDPKQYFMLENRQRNWGYDKPLYYECKSGGVAIYHIDTSVLDACTATYGSWYRINDNETHKAVDLEEANQGVLGYSELDGYYNPWEAYGGQYNHLYRTGDTAIAGAFTAGASPSSNLYDGSASGVNITVTSASAATMQVSLGLQVNGVTADKPSPQKQFRTVRWTCLTEGSGSVTYKFDVYRDSVRTGGTDAYTSQAWFDWTPDAAGAYTITASVLAEGVSAPIVCSAGFAIEADVTPPVILVTSGGAAVPSGAVVRGSVAATATDPEGGTLAALSYSLNGGVPVAGWPAEFTADGAYALTAIDRAGNTATFAFAVDRTAPVITAASGTALANGMTAGTAVTVSVSEPNPGSVAATRDGAAYTWPAGGVFTESGIYIVTATDAVGNASSFRFAIYPNGDKLQVTAGGAYLIHGDATVSDISIQLTDASWSVEVRVGGMTLQAWQGAEPHVFTAEGVYSVTATGASGSLTMNFTVDRSAPVISARNALNAVVKAGSIHTSSVTVSVYDITGASNAAVRDGAAYAWPSGGRFTEDGRYTVTATDFAGHAASFSFSIDLKAPVIAVNAGGARVGNKGYARTNATAVVTDVSAVKKTVRKNGRNMAWPSGGVFKAEGVYVITAIDKYKRKSTFTFTVDKSAPAIKGSPKLVNGKHYRSIVTVTVSDKYLSAKSVTKNGVAIAWPRRNRFTASGSYTVMARDKAGNMRTLSFVIDRTVPYVYVVTLSGSSVKRSGAAYGGVIVTVSDQWLAGKSVKLGARTIAWPSNSKFTRKGAYTVTARDRAGNTTTFRFTVK